MDKLRELVNWIETKHGSLPASRLSGKEVEEIREILEPALSDKDLQADIDKVIKPIDRCQTYWRIYSPQRCEEAEIAREALDRIVARIPEPNQERE